MQPAQIAGADARPSIGVLGISNHPLGEHRLNRDLATPNTLQQAIKP